MKKQTENLYIPFHLFNKLEFNEIKMFAYILHKNRYVAKCESTKDFIDINLNELTTYLQLSDNEVRELTKNLIDKQLITIKEHSIAINWYGVVNLNDDVEHEEQDEISKLKAIIEQQKKEMALLRLKDATHELKKSTQMVYYNNQKDDEMPSQDEREYLVKQIYEESKKREFNDLPF